MTECPNCGQALQFTMFAPPGYQMEEATHSCNKEEWHGNSAAYEQLELPIGVRLSQIGAGIGIYCFISRTVMNFFFAICLVGETNIQLEQLAITFLVMLMVFHIIGALAGGAVAGAWSVNWVPQGIGVGVGVFISPLIMHFLFAPVKGIDLLTFMFVICITTTISVFGAFIGHKLIQPTRFITS